MLGNTEIMFKSHFYHQNVLDFVIMYATLLWVPFHNITKICKPPVVYLL